MLRITGLGRRVFAYQTLTLNNRIGFATTDKKPQEEVDLADFRLVRGTANYFYRNSLRRLTEKNKDFNHHHLHRIVKLSKTKKDALLSYEAYYNYLGRRVVMTHYAVDRLIVKTAQIAMNQPLPEQIHDNLDIADLNQKIVNRILQLYKRHQYLKYFPHFEATASVIQLCSRNEQNLQQLVGILSDKWLIKLNNQCFQLLFESMKTSSWPMASRILKLIGLRLSLIQKNGEWSGQAKRDIFIKAFSSVTQNPESGHIQLSKRLVQQLQLRANQIKTGELLPEEQEKLILACAIGNLTNNQVDESLTTLSSLSALNQGSKPYFQYLKRLQSAEDSQIDNVHIQKRLAQLREGRDIHQTVNQYFHQTHQAN